MDTSIHYGSRNNAVCSHSIIPGIFLQSEKMADS